jgi:calcineurin-like phosphoesterase family protein
MSNRFIVSDHHFSHTNTWAKFKLADGSPMRPFSSNEEMDEMLVENHNKVVKPGDSCYFLGDVAIAKRGLEFVKRLNGRKRLIRGNHDIFKDKDYYEAGFEQIHGVRVWVDRFIMSHIPLHPDCISERFVSNIHGHLHSNEVQWKVENTSEINSFGGGTWFEDRPDPRYLCVSVEQVNYTPISFEDAEILVKKRMEDANYERQKNSWGNGSKPS